MQSEAGCVVEEGYRMNTDMVKLLWEKPVEVE